MDFLLSWKGSVGMGRGQLPVCPGRATGGMNAHKKRRRLQCPGGARSHKAYLWRIGETGSIAQESAFTMKKNRLVMSMPPPLLKYYDASVNCRYYTAL